jgi:hypothetical protein
MITTMNMDYEILLNNFNEINLISDVIKIIQSYIKYYDSEKMIKEIDIDDVKFFENKKFESNDEKKIILKYNLGTIYIYSLSTNKIRQIYAPQYSSCCTEIKNNKIYASNMQGIFEIEILENGISAKKLIALCTEPEEIYVNGENMCYRLFTRVGSGIYLFNLHKVNAKTYNCDFNDFMYMYKDFIYVFKYTKNEILKININSDKEETINLNHNMRGYLSYNARMIVDEVHIYILDGPIIYCFDDNGRIIRKINFEDRNYDSYIIENKIFIIKKSDGRNMQIWEQYVK